MPENLDGDLRRSLPALDLPGAPRSVIDFRDALPSTQNGQQGRSISQVVFSLAGAAALVAVIAMIAIAPRLTAPSSGASTPTTSPAGPPLTVSAALAARASGSVGDQALVVTGYWSDNLIPHTCAVPETPEGELAMSCHDGEFGITEQEEAILQIGEDGTFSAAKSPHLTPYLSDALRDQLLNLPRTNGKPPAPMRITVMGHFDDPRAADCRANVRQGCADRFVVDRIVAFGP